MKVWMTVNSFFYTIVHHHLFIPLRYFNDEFYLLCNCKEEKERKKEKRRNIQLHVNLISFVILTNSKKEDPPHKREEKWGGGEREKLTTLVFYLQQPTMFEK